MNYQELHTYISTLQAILNCLRSANPLGVQLAKLKEIKTLTDNAIRKER